ncbi:UDP-glucuronate decarboxylase [Gloeomargarita lithophora Alchichica-D10]|uniref:UDP-glucuronate decarboxylase n=1 Tax=Gloeomargarita lithophora Alchichica-D10 TaxID=1188229 RepID=A0A1J0A9U3_9CYAN|nr:UDP-glucuronic acid decarboxylase family protein [Gloeomargarita lithophora]APB32699.1 UDP-glucuronate decarboxylase [Gloeomargarita lithophora Alchichica-D10]
MGGTVLLTGAAGFVGSHLTDRLVRDDWRVIAVDNCSTGSWENLAHWHDHPQVQKIQHDVITPLAIDEPLDWVMHFASPASPPKYLALPLATLRVNSEGTFHLLELARRRGAQFFLASTSEVYGDPLEHPQREDYWGHVNCTGPRSVYDEAKRYAEAMTLAFHRQYGLSIRIIRIFNTHGPRMDILDGRVVTNFIHQALRGEPLTIYGNGNQTRSFQYVDDLIEGIVRLMAVNYPYPVNLGNPQELTVLELAQVIQELTGTQSVIKFHPLPQDDPQQRRPDITLAQTKLQWSPQVDLRTGLGHTIADIRQRC